MVDSRKVRKKLEAAGWETRKKRGKGSHTVLMHPAKPGIITLPKCSGDIATGTLKNIEEVAGFKLR